MLPLQGGSKRTIGYEDATLHENDYRSISNGVSGLREGYFQIQTSWEKKM